MSGKIQNEDIKSAAELVADGATAASLPNDTKVYVTALGLNKTLSQAIIDGNLSGTGGGTLTENFQTGTSYTFALGDVGELVSLNNASPVTATIPPNSSVAFPIGSTIQVIQKGAGLVTIAPGAGVTLDSLNSSTSLAGEYAEVTLVKTATNTWYLYGGLAQVLVTATGGTITTDGNFKVHTFTSSGTFTITQGDAMLTTLVVGGGGGGSGGAMTGGEAGGGAGGLLYNNTGPFYSAGAYTVTVGAGGANAVNGSDSIFDTLTAFGGGAGGVNNTNGNAGGSGGGGSPAGGNTGGAATSGQGYAGGGSDGTTGGGGGGAGGAGGVPSYPSLGGNGGAGRLINITGTPTYYASGGGGGDGVTPGTASAGGGGAGIVSPTGTAHNGTANTGGGGGGGLNNTVNGGAGGSGVVIVRYKFK